MANNVDLNHTLTSQQAATVQINFKSIVGGNTKKCLDNFVKIIKDDLHLMRDQIVSISIHDTRVHHGDLEAVVFYRTQTLSASSEPLEDLKVHVIERDEDVSWDDILAELLISANAPGQSLVTLAHTFRGVGDEKIAVCFSVDGVQKGQIFQESFHSHDDSWDVLIEKARTFMNSYITPNEFAGISMFEDEHPLAEREAATGQRRIVVYHTVSPAYLQPIKELKPDLVIGDIYEFKKLEVPESQGWPALYHEVANTIERREDVLGWYLTTANTSDERAFGYCTGLLVKYEKPVAENLKDLRQTGCCVIF